MKKVHKIILGDEVEVPYNSTILCVKNLLGLTCLFVESDIEVTEKRKFKSFLTGEEVTGTYIGTVIHGIVEEHIYEIFD